MPRRCNSKFYFAIAALTFFVVPLFAFAYTSPGKPTGYVNDFAGIINAADKAAIETSLSDLQKTTGVQIAVVTINSLGDETIESYAVKLFEEWGIGNKDIDNGLLFLIAPNEKEVRKEVGYGLEGTVTDIQSGQIIRKEIIPEFKAGNYSQGIMNGVSAILSVINKAPGSEIYSEPIQGSSGNYNWQSFVFIFIVALNILARSLGKTKSWWLGGVIGAAIGGVVGLIFGFLFAGVASIVILTLLGLLFDYLVSKKGPYDPNKPGNHPWWMGGGMGGKPGGFGGFGGGGSGGGGASGRW